MLEKNRQYVNFIGKKSLILRIIAIIMENNMPLHLQEIIYGSSDNKINKQINRWEREGKIKKIAPRIYTGKLDVAPEIIIRRNILPILGQNYKGRCR